MAQIVPASTLDASGRSAAAGLIAEALAPYYRYLGLSGTALRDALAEELVETGTELEHTSALMKRDAPIAIMAAYPADEMADRQRASLFHLISSFEDDADALIGASAAHAASVGDVPTGSYYLARLAIDEANRGMGTAGELMHLLAGQAGGRPLSLHVHADNARAIALYSREGFTLNPDSGAAYRCMTRS